jgi:hypothetical protein
LPGFGTRNGLGERVENKTELEFQRQSCGSELNKYISELERMNEFYRAHFEVCNSDKLVTAGLKIKSLESENAQLKTMDHRIACGADFLEDRIKILENENARLRAQEQQTTAFIHSLEADRNDMVLIRERMYRKNAALESKLAEAEKALEWIVRNEEVPTSESGIARAMIMADLAREALASLRSVLDGKGE